MKTDSLFYQIFLNFPTIFFELINQPNTNTQTYEFTSREVKQLSFRLDGLFLPTDNSVIKPENQASNLAKSLIIQAQEEIIEPKIQRDLIDLIETIIVYKLPQKNQKGD